MVKYIQKSISIYLITVFVLLSTGCDKFKDFEAGGPDQIVKKAVKVYNDKNAEKFISLFSKGAIKKMEHSLQALRMQFKILDPQYRHDLAEKMNMDPKSLANLTMADYVLFNMNIQTAGMGSDNIIFPINEVVEADFITTEVKDGKAFVKYEHTTITLVKEKNLWKIDTFEVKNEKTATNSDESP